MSMQSSLPDDVRESFNYYTECTLNIVQSNIVKNSLRKHVEYLIEGTDDSGEFKVARRYKEFLHMRKLLRKAWPGCYIPQVPPKKLFGNIKDQFIDKRQKLLQAFLARIAAIHFLYKSEVFQLFLTYEGSYMDVNFREYDFDAISEVYKRHFSENFIGNNDEEIQDAIAKSIDTFQDTIPMLKSLKKDAKKSAEAYSHFGKHSASFTISLQKITETYADTFDPVSYTHLTLPTNREV